jgi:hypothetical protein
VPDVSTSPVVLRRRQNLVPCDVGGTGHAKTFLARVKEHYLEYPPPGPGELPSIGPYWVAVRWSDEVAYCGDISYDPARNAEVRALCSVGVFYLHDILQMALLMELAMLYTDTPAERCICAVSG